MQLQKMFEKQIDRDIKGVIKVGQSDDENIYQELEEYVVTKELLRHFRDFFENYEKGIGNTTDKMGVWISGFFGSGKSHFLKILSYLLENKEVEGKKAISYFTGCKANEIHLAGGIRPKIDDPMLIAKMTNSGNVSSDVMLFNIDSKGSAKVGSGKEAIVEVFMKVFNEMQGYCGSIPYLAEFERQLDNEGRFGEFKEKFEANTGFSWEKKRQAFAVIQDKIVKTIVDMDFMSEEAARNWCKNAKSAYDLSIEKFVGLVQEYLAKKGSNHHVIFLVDEIGQYIADDTQLMLNLQTIVEDLGTACRGKAWVIVTSQEDIDSITKTKGNDFSKIQGRFDTRLSLSASNVDEVIRKRILEKNEAADQTLRLLYDKYESIIKNLITFTADTADKKLYADRSDFASCYPFIPYQFNLLGQVLTAIRVHGASGKHLSDQSRSMLALFQESAVRVMDKEEGVLIPFSFFYDPLHKFIDHQHSTVITQAESYDSLEEFDIELLKVLFMIKYVKEIKANVDNLTTLMISNINDERVEVRKKVEESLKKLIKETLVQKNGEIYIFLTNEEQEINNAIHNETAEMGEIIGEASTVIFEEIYTEKKYRYSNRYLFPFNQKVDDRFFKGNQSNDIGITVITPYGEEYTDAALRMLSAAENSVIVKLPNDDTFLDEIAESIKIYKFLNKNAAGARGTFESIRGAKEDERLEKKDRIRIFIEEALKNADIYGLQNELTPEVEDKDVTVRKADLSRDIRSLLSYAVGCMFGRYSVAEEGLIYAGGDFEEKYALYTGTFADTADYKMDGKYTFGELVSRFYYLKSENKKALECYKVDYDNIIPITDEEYFQDDIVGLFCDWLKKVYGADTLEENLDFIAAALGNKGGTSREIIRNYFLNDFMADHMKIYQKRPIYWLFDSGKTNGFKALIYLHRYHQDTVGTVRTEYLHKTQKSIEQALERAEYISTNGTGSEKAKATKQITKYTKQLAEIRIYDEAMAHIANQRIAIDLDDGVKVNYAKFQGVEVAQEGKKTVKVDLLAKIK